MFAAACLNPMAAAASGFVPPAGNLWVKVDYSSWQANQKYAGIFDRNLRDGIELGEPIAFDSSTGGELDTQMVAVTAMFTPVERLQLGFYIPAFQHVVFEDSTFRSKTVGVGDLRPWVGWQVTPNSIPVATQLNAKFKIPLTTLPAEFETIPLGEGQLDFAVEQHTSWTPTSSLMLSVRTLFRRRTVFVDGDRRIKPGDEAEVGLTVGGAPFDGLWLKAGYEGLWSTGSEDRSGTGAVTLRDRRQVQDLVAGAYLSFGKWISDATAGLALDTSIRHPIYGQDYPVGLTWSAGLAWSLDLH